MNVNDLIAALHDACLVDPTLRDNEVLVEVNDGYEGDTWLDAVLGVDRHENHIVIRTGVA